MQYAKKLSHMDKSIFSKNYKKFGDLLLTGRHLYFLNYSIGAFGTGTLSDMPMLSMI